MLINLPRGTEFTLSQLSDLLKESTFDVAITLGQFVRRGELSLIIKVVLPGGDDFGEFYSLEAVPKKIGDVEVTTDNLRISYRVR